MRTSIDEKELARFFEVIWTREDEYKVLMTPRTFNLNFLFGVSMRSQYDREHITKHIISDTALLLCAEEIADYYSFCEEFPSILIVDEFLGDGRRITKLIDDFETLVVSFLEKKDVKEENIKKVHSKLFESLFIYVFSRNVNDVLLNSKLPIGTFSSLSTKEVNEILQKTTSLLQQHSIANANYAFTVELPYVFSDDDKKFEDASLFQYKENMLRYYYKNTDDLIFETVRMYRSRNNRFFNRTVTSQVLFGNISCDDKTDNNFNELCSYISDEIKKIIPNSRIAERLSYDQDILIKPRAEMLNYLFSVLSFCDFYHEMISSDSSSLLRTLFTSNSTEIATYFAIPIHELGSFFRYVSNNKGIKATMFREMEKYIIKSPQEKVYPNQIRSVQRWTVGNKLGVNSSLALANEFAENIISEIGMSAAHEKKKFSQNNQFSTPSLPKYDFILLEQYLRIMKINGNKEIPSIGILLNLIDNGFAIMDFKLNDTDGLIYQTLKVSELSQSILPRRFSFLVSSLSFLEQKYRHYDKRLIASIFLNSLLSSNDLEDPEFFYKIRKYKPELLYTYTVGLNFNDWDFELLTSSGPKIDEYGNYNVNELKMEHRRKHRCLVSATYFRPPPNE